MQKQKILIVDDSGINRSILADILGEEYEILEAEDGVQAIAILQKYAMGISVVLLDIVMPHMDGFEVLKVMNQKHWIEDTPVIMISAETSSKQVEQAYELGVTDFIMRPFDALIVYRRVVNTVFLYTKQKRLLGLVAAQIDAKERSSSMMVDILSHIVEFRNGESSQHIVHVRTLTELFLRQLQKRTDRYQLTQTDISIISTASALHDIGKIAIDEKILNKPGRLTKEEFVVMRTHAQIGADMLKGLPDYQDEPLLKYGYEICRWHHERYDGKGYPDGLPGEKIPIAAQVVALADVYDALTSDRCYKKAFPHKQAVQMIRNGECGTFNPLLLECLQSVEDTLESELASVRRQKKQSRNNLTKELLHGEKLFASERSLQLIYQERMKYNFFSAMTEEIQFEYTTMPAMLNLSNWGAVKLGLPEDIMDPMHDADLISILGENVWEDIHEKVMSTTPEHPVIGLEYPLHINGELRWYRIIIQSMWSGDEPPQCTGVIGKAVDIHDSRSKMQELEKRAAHDTMTGLLNHANAREMIQKRISQNPDGKYALGIFDLDEFKTVNDTYGHIFGNRVLQHVAEKLQQSARKEDIVARIGGDEFLIFLEDEAGIETEIQRLFDALIGVYEGIDVSVSMGVAQSDVVGNEYAVLFHAADQALYSAKRTGRSHYVFYDESMQEMLSVVSGTESNT